MSKKEFILNYLECSYNEIENNPKLAYKISRQHMITKLDIPQRTLDRNISALIKENKIEEKLVNRKKYYTYIQKSKSKEFLLTQEECEALDIAREFLSAYKNTPLEEHFNSALKKIKQSSIEFKKHKKKDYNKFYIDHMPHVAFFNKDSFKKISTALDEKKVINIEYFTFRAREGNKFQPNEHVIEPYQFIFKDVRWYLFAYNIQTKHFSLYAISRIKSIKELNTTFVRRNKLLAQFIKTKMSTIVPEMVSSISTSILPYIYEMNIFNQGKPFLKDRWQESLNEKIAFQDGKYYANLPQNIKYKIRFNEFEWESLAYKYSFRKWALGWGKELTVQGPKAYVESIYKEISVMKVNYEKRLQEIDDNQKEYNSLLELYRNNPQKVIDQLCLELKLSCEEAVQQTSEDIVTLFFKENYQADKGSIKHYLNYLNRVKKLTAPISDIYGNEL